MRNIYPTAGRGYQPYPHPHNSINGINRYPQVNDDLFIFHVRKM